LKTGAIHTGPAQLTHGRLVVIAYLTPDNRKAFNADISSLIQQLNLENSKHL
jgi:hypothetical protein